MESDESQSKSGAKEAVLSDDVLFRDASPLACDDESRVSLTSTLSKLSSTQSSSKSSGSSRKSDGLIKIEGLTRSDSSTEFGEKVNQATSKRTLDESNEMQNSESESAKEQWEMLHLYPDSQKRLDLATYHKEKKREKRRRLRPSDDFSSSIIDISLGIHSSDILSQEPVQTSYSESGRTPFINQHTDIFASEPLSSPEQFPNSETSSNISDEEIRKKISYFNCNYKVHLMSGFITFNCRTEISSPENFFHFLTNINRHSSRSSEILNPKIKKVYTTPFLKWYVETTCPMTNVKFIEVNENVETKITGFKDAYGRSHNFTFTFLNGKYRPGSVMVLLKGEFGHYLYADYCRFSSSLWSSNSPLSTYALGNKKSEKLDKVFFDGTYYACEYVVPQREHVIEKVIELIIANLDRFVNIVSTKLGFEVCLARIAEVLNKKIYVWPSKMEVMDRLGFSRYFTTDKTITNIRAIPDDEFNTNKCNDGSIHILLSANHSLIKKGNQASLENKGIFTFMYTDHSSDIDLHMLCSSFKVKSVVVIKANKIVRKPRIAKIMSKEERPEITLDTIWNIDD